MSGAVPIWFAYGEHRDALVRMPREKGTTAAREITQFVAGIERQLGWMMPPIAYAGLAGADQRSDPPLMGMSVALPTRLLQRLRRLDLIVVPIDPDELARYP